MTNEQFIKEIAKYVQKYAPEFGIKVCSPIIAQACLESQYGNSELAKNAMNFFGLKYRPNRCPSACGIYYKDGAEQNADGTYTNSAMQWMKFSNMEMGVKGYFEFINISTYKALKGITDPYKYLETIKACGYATSLKYVENVYSVITKWGLTKYDTVEDNSSHSSSISSGYSNSSLITYKNISPNKTSPRTHKIDTITIHCIVGQWTAKQGCDYFAKSSAKASANYVVGKDGSIGLCVEEKDRSWCSSNAANDHRAITIEVASDTTHPYAVTDKALSALIKLCADICKRNGIKKLLWKGDKSLIGQVDKQNMTVHRWFKQKACPGDYLYERHGYIADEVNKLLGASSSSTSTVTTNLYRVRKSWKDAASQKGAYSSLDNAKKNCPSGYSVFDKDGNVVYSNVPVQDTKKYYRVQTGSYAIEKNAIALQEKLKKKGFSSIIKKVGLLHKVQVGAYSKKENAEAMLKQLKANGFSAFIVYN